MMSTYYPLPPFLLNPCLKEKKPDLEIAWCFPVWVMLSWQLHAAEPAEQRLHVSIIGPGSVGGRVGGLCGFTHAERGDTLKLSPRSNWSCREIYVLVFGVYPQSAAFFPQTQDFNIWHTSELSALFFMRICLLRYGRASAAWKGRMVKLSIVCSG